MNNKGFTLVEVLVSIIIIMILATYSVLKYTETVRDGENRVAKAQLELVAGAYNRYLMENPEKPLNGLVSYAEGICTAACAECASGYGEFQCGKVAIKKLKYLISLGPDANDTCCSDCIATMKAREGVSVGDKFTLTSGYCAYIDRYGRAVDGHLN